MLSPRRSVLLAVLAATLAAVAYLNSLHGPFTYDDQHEIVENASIEDLTNPVLVMRASPTRPLVNLSYALDYSRTGRDVFGYHATNVALHVANCLLLFMVAGALVRHREDEAATQATPRSVDFIAFLTAALFAVHPLMTESVSYISSRSELLVCGFMLAALYCFSRVWRRGPRWLAAGAGFFVLALGSKETAAMFPFIFLAADIFLSQQAEWKNRLRRIHIPLIATVLVAGGFRWWRYVTLEQQGVGAPFTWAHVAQQAYVYCRYISLLIVPAGQSIVPSISPIVRIGDPRILIAGVGLASVASLIVYFRRRAPIVSFGLVWFTLALVPSSLLSLPEKINQPMAEHRTYTGAGGFFLAAAALTAMLARIDDASTSRGRFLRLTSGIGLVLAVLLTFTVARNRLWADPVELWTDAANKAPGVFAAQAGLGYAQWLAGNCHEAETAYRRAMDLRPQESDPYVVLADCFLRRNELQNAMAILRDGVGRAPREVKIALVLAGLEERRFQNPAEALRICRKVLEVAPGNLAALDCVRRNEQIDLSRGR